jgi:hypothetical protein
MCSEYYKRAVFEECEKLYEAAMLECEGHNGSNQNELERAKILHDKSYKNIINLISEYYENKL